MEPGALGFTPGFAPSVSFLAQLRPHREIDELQRSVGEPSTRQVEVLHKYCCCSYHSTEAPQEPHPGCRDRWAECG